MIVAPAVCTVAAGVDHQIDRQPNGVHRARNNPGQSGKLPLRDERHGADLVEGRLTAY
jgi:hypothetical protein